jgi:hypothetical protein
MLFKKHFRNNANVYDFSARFAMKQGLEHARLFIAFLTRRHLFSHSRPADFKTGRIGKSTRIDARPSRILFPLAVAAEYGISSNCSNRHQIR